ncbi:hypothetical protein L218DRAFT_327785 [Marasmius fiardii PR-910]|nr:hypothetical protein L218DRAFT_327785 [Marasmius fiardii PR-910]
MTSISRAPTTRVKGPRGRSNSSASRSSGGSGLELSRRVSSESTSSTSSSASSSSISSTTSCAWFGIDYCECCSQPCHLRRRAHVRRQHRRPRAVKPLPKVPSTLVNREIQGYRTRIRRLPDLPLSRTLTPGLIFPEMSPTTCSTPMPILDDFDYPDSPSSGEIDWEILLNEIISPRDFDFESCTHCQH